MNRAQQLLTLLSGGAAATYAEYMTNTVAPLFWGKFDEASGSLINYGSVGSALNGAVSGTVTYAQTGLLGTGQAYLFPSTDGTALLTNHASIQGMTSFTMWFVGYLSGAGGLNTGTLCDKASELFFRLAGAGRQLTATINYGTTSASTTTNEALSLGQWYTIALTHSSADKTSHIYINGIEATYSTQTAGVGTRGSATNGLYLANHSPLARYWNGYLDEAMVVNRVLDAPTLLQLDTLTRAA